MSRPMTAKPEYLPTPEFADMREEAMYAEFISEYQAELPDITSAQLRVLHMAGVEYVLHSRLQAEQLRSGKAGAYLNTRWSHLADMLKLLESLGLTCNQTRKTFIASGDSNAEDDLTDALLSLSIPDPAKRAKIIQEKHRSRNV